MLGEPIVEDMSSNTYGQLANGSLYNNASHVGNPHKPQYVITIYIFKVHIQYRNNHQIKYPIPKNLTQVPLSPTPSITITAPNSHIHYFKAQMLGRILF